MSSTPLHPKSRRRAMSSPPAPPDAGDPASQPIFTDEILGEIFLRLDSAADLARASAACTAFLRVVRFLRLNRSLYRQPAVGFLHSEFHTPPYPISFYHAELPHSSASAARALAEAADFTCSFLPNPLGGSRRVLRDTSGGRVLLSSSSPDSTSHLEDLVVCDPLQRRYVRIPPIPEELTAGTCMTGITLYFLAATGEEEESSFRVIWVTCTKTEVTAFIFSSATSQWRRVTFNGWEWEYIRWENVIGVLTSCRYHPRSSLYSEAGLFSEVLMLDTHKMVFSVVRTPRVHHYQQHAIIEAVEGRLGFLTIVNGMLDLCCKAWQGNSVSAEEWQHEKTIPIPLPDSDRYSISFCGMADGYLLIQAIPPESAKLEQKPEIHYFTLNVKTLLVERFCLLNKRINFAHLYSNFLPPLSLPSV